VPRLDGAPDRWREQIRRIEDAGFAAVSVSDHFTQGWGMEATIALMAAADATDRLRVQALVLSNDYRHPVLLHKALATIDVLSAGRLEIGLGAGWMQSDYEAAGLALDPPAVRVARLEESVSILKGLFADDPFTFVGKHYHVQALDGLPKSVQRPHPPLLLGGGGRRVLSLAAREADIVSLHPRLRSGHLDRAAANDLSPERLDEKVGWVCEALAANGRQPQDVELQLNLFVVRIGRSTSAVESTHAAGFLADPDLLAQSPAVLIGSVEQCAEALLERRERYGLSCFNMGSDFASAAPLVARLAGS
jgi:probable F420-dependent oxidoreductase